MGRIYRRDNRFGIDYVDGRGRRQRKVVATDKAVAQRILADRESDAERLKAGILTVDPQEAKKPWAEHVDEYLDDLKRRGRDGMYAYIVKRHLLNAAEEQDWGSLADVTTRGVNSYLGKLGAEGLSGKTVNAHRADLSAFFTWAVRNSVLEANPCEKVAKTQERKDKTRRALSIAEVRALCAASPPDRRAVYLFLTFTGLRRAEAAAIRWGHVHLGVANPYVELPPDITKSGQAESVPLVPEVAAALAQRQGKDRQPVFDDIPSMPLFRQDLKAAGIEEEDSRGRKVVLHSLRHSLATMLAASQVPPAIAQRILRHRDIKLTLQHYTDDALLPLAAAMGQLPSMAAG